MGDSTASRRPPAPGWYEIRVTGRLASRWADRFDGMVLTTGPDGTTIIAGLVVDQAALHGLLRTLGDLGLPLVSLTQVHQEPGTTHSTDDIATQGD